MKKANGKTAWLITWEGPDSEHNGRCKVVAVLPPRVGEKSITPMLRFLYCSEYSFTLCEKMEFGTPNTRDPFFKEAYRDINPEFWYGLFPKEYLCLRKVKDLRCEESQQDCCEATLHWTECSRYIPNPDIEANGPLPDNPSAWLKEVRGERDSQYTYSTRSSIEAEKTRRARLKS
jgi:hypothetical protein